MNFYLTHVMSGHRVFIVYLFCMRLVGSPECANCDKKKGLDDDAWHTMCECPAFQLFQEDEMIILQKMGNEPLPLDLVPFMVQRAKGWDQVAAFVALTAHHKMELAREWQRRPVAVATYHPMPDLVIPFPHVFVTSNPAMEEGNPDWSISTSTLDGSQ